MSAQAVTKLPGAAGQRALGASGDGQVGEVDLIENVANLDGLHTVRRQIRYGTRDLHPDAGVRRRACGVDTGPMQTGPPRRPAAPGQRPVGTRARRDGLNGSTRRRRLLGRLLPLLVVSFVLVVVVGSALEPAPPVTVTRLLTHQIVVGGAKRSLPWPSGGEAALQEEVTDGLIGRSGSEKAVPIASIAKVMTAYLVLRQHPLARGSSGFRLTITRSEAASMPQRYAEGQSLIPVHAGEVLTERQALEALLVPSADNIADALAAYIGPTYKAFISRMNSTARQLGMSHTHFADASGYDPKTVSDAVDLLKLGQVAMTIPAFASIVSLPTVQIAGATYRNYNSLVGQGGFTGIKTGSTSQAAQALLFSVRRKVDGHTWSIIGDVLEQHGPGVVGGALERASRLADGYYSELAARLALPAGTSVARLERAGHVAYAKTTAPLRVVSLPGTPVRLSLDLKSARDGRESAVVTGRCAGCRLVRLSARARPLPAPGFWWKLEHFL